MSKLSDYLNSRLPAGWSKTRVVEELDGRIDRATVYRYLAGQHPQRPSESILEAFASLPGMSLTEIRVLVGAAAGEESPWVPAREANRLNHGQRMALDAFIRATVAAQDVSDSVKLIADLLAERRPQPMRAETRANLAHYIEQLYTSGRDGLAERLAASLAISSASQTAKRSAKE